MTTPKTETKKVLVLLNDSDPLLNRVVKNKLNKEKSWECITSLSYDDALNFFRTAKPDMVITEVLITDYKNRTGIELIAEMRSIEKNTGSLVPMIVFTELDDVKFHEEAVRLGATACFSKNHLSLNEFLDEIQKHMS